MTRPTSCGGLLWPASRGLAASTSTHRPNFRVVEQEGAWSAGTHSLSGRSRNCGLDCRRGSLPSSGLYIRRTGTENKRILSRHVKDEEIPLPCAMPGVTRRALSEQHRLFHQMAHHPEHTPNAWERATHGTRPPSPPTFDSAARSLLGGCNAVPSFRLRGDYAPCLVSACSAFLVACGKRKSDFPLSGFREPAHPAHPVSLR